jgi:tetratricopeptide (TPR) repeat protein
VGSDKLDRARACLDKARSIARRRNQRQEIEGAWQVHGQRLQWQERYADAAAFYEGALASCREADATERTAKIACDLGYCLQQLGRLEEAEAVTRRSLALHVAAERSSGKAIALYHLAGIAFDRGQIDESIAHAREAITTARDSRDRRSEAFFLYALARASYEHGHTHDAEVAARTGLALADELGLDVLQPNFSNMLANVALDDNRAAEAAEHYERALEAFRRQRLANHAAITTANLGNLAWDCGRLDEALERHDKALRGHRKAKDERSRAIVLTDRAGVLAELGRFDEAQRNLDEALALTIRLGHLRRASFVRAMFATLAEARDELEEARAHYAEAEMAFDQVGDAVQIGRMLLAMAGLTADTGDVSGAETLLARAEALDPSMDPEVPRALDAPPPRAGAACVRALRELAIGRIELARARFAGPAEAATLHTSALARLRAITTARDSLIQRSAEVRRVARRLERAASGSRPG